MLKWGLWKLSKKYNKKYKNMKFTTIFSGFRGLNYSSYQISEATYQQAIVFGQKTPGGQETWTNYTNILNLANLALHLI